MAQVASASREAIVTQEIAWISEHAWPLGVIGGVDAGGGRNFFVANVAMQLCAARRRR
ncbi:hypothetical protein [Burkholderia mayonis]|uniref:hypothetical protein n=1 Tax=Burkholderia mayonis TaxID=1385591 RepID=UPI00131ED722